MNRDQWLDIAKLVLIVLLLLVCIYFGLKNMQVCMEKAGTPFCHVVVTK